MAPIHSCRSRAFRPPSRRVAGVGLIEILIAVTILAFGLLGIAAMQATTLRNSQVASQRSEAAIGTSAILERMRANYAVAANGGYDLATMTCEAPTTTGLVKGDQRDWVNALQASLGPDACGQIVSCGGSTCTIIVQWNESRNGGSETQRLTTETRL